MTTDHTIPDPSDPVHVTSVPAPGAAPARATEEAWIDKDGDVWTFDRNGRGTSPETAHFARSYVEKKWGPPRPVAADVPPRTEGAEVVPDLLAALAVSIEQARAARKAGESL